MRGENPAMFKMGNAMQKNIRKMHPFVLTL
jgi:hypothetical protein